MNLATPSRHLAFNVLREIDRKATYTDLALDRVFRQETLTDVDKRLTTELVYGVVRRQRTLDALIEQLGKRPLLQQPPDLRRILQLGLYQLRYLSQIPASAAVNTSVELAKTKGLSGLSKVVNGLLRYYLRLAQEKADPLLLPTDRVQRIGIEQSFPDWIVELALRQWGEAKTETLFDWFNQAPTIDLRVNLLKISREKLEAAFKLAGIPITPLKGLPQGLRLGKGVGNIARFPGYEEGWWTIQEGSAQWVSHWLDPQAGEMIVDACAAPGGKTTHIAELSQDKAKIWACDRTESRLRKLRAHCERLDLRSIEILTEDSAISRRWDNSCDRLLLDVPCSGLGTLHRHPDIRWRQSREQIDDLISLQRQLLKNTADWVKPGGVLVYSTCTLNVAENQAQIQEFLAQNPQWHLVPPPDSSAIAASASPEGWVTFFPPDQQLDGFFMAKLKKD
jgi:16S rRNA (cytosine967-C5)-methyltransferase